MIVLSFGEWKIYYFISFGFWNYFVINWFFSCAEAHYVLETVLKIINSGMDFYLNIWRNKAAI